MKRMFIPLFSALLLAITAGPAQAQVPKGSTSFGAQMSLGENVDLGLGGRVGFGLAGVVEKLQGTVTLNIFFPGQNTSYWGLNANALYPLKLESGAVITPYAGAGLGIARYSNRRTETKLNLNLVAGTLFGSREKLVPFAEIRLPVWGIDNIGFFLTGGIWF